MNEDFLNIWVVVHDKATSALNSLSKSLRDADSGINKLDNSLGKLDNQQVKSAQHQLNFGKNMREAVQTTEKYRNTINDLINARKKDEAAAASAAKAEERLQASKDKSFRSQLDNARKLDQTLKGSTAKDSIRDIDKAAKDLTSRFDKAGKETERLGSRTRGLTGEMSRLRQENERNAPAATKLGRALQSLNGHLDNNSKSAGIFRQNFAGLRVGILGLTTILPIAIGALTDLAGLLIAVASAAALAGAAIGGALVASMAQAAPVIGLLVVAFKQLSDIIKLTGQQQKLAGQAAHDATDKSLALSRRLEQERQAHVALANAQKQLIQARRDALRNIQDLNAAEKEAEATSRRATLSLIGSQAALAGLVAGGGSALDIASAQQDVQDSQRGISRAKLNQGRAAADAAQARRQGIAGNAQVVAAQQTIIQQQHQLIQDAKEYAAAQNKVSSAMDMYRQALARLDPAQRRLFDAVVALRKEFKTEWRGITDPIINAFTGIVKSITTALKDPAIQNAFKALSGATGSAITQSTSFFGTPEAKKLFLQVMRDARQNLPLIANILRDISVLFLRIAVAAGPFVHDILKGISNFFDDITRKSANSKALSDFFTFAFQAAYAFWTVITGILDIFVALGTDGGAKTGVDLIGQLGKYLHNIAEELRGNKSGVSGFFDTLRTTVRDLGTLLDHVLRGLVKIANTGAFDALIKVLDRLVLPALIDILVLAGKIITALSNFTLAHPDLVKTGLIIAGIFFAGFKLFGIIQSIGKGMVALGLIGEVALGPIALIILGLAVLGTGIYLLDKKFHFLGPTFKWLKGQWVGLAESAERNFNRIEQAANWLNEKLGPIFKNIGQHQIDRWIINKLNKNGATGALSDLLEWLTTHSLVDAFALAFNGVGKVITNVIDKIQSVLDKLGLLNKSLLDILGITGGSGKGQNLPGGQVNPRYRGNRGTLSGASPGGGPAPGISGVGGSSGNAILDTASSAIGVPYVWGGTSLTKGVDCSGLVWAAAKKRGYNIPRRSQEQAHMGVEVAQGDLRAGDLLFYGADHHHESIYAGNGMMLEAQKSGTNVSVVPFRTNGLTAMRRVSEWDLAAADSSTGGGGGGTHRGGLHGTGTPSYTNNTGRGGPTNPVQTNTDPSRTPGRRSAVNDIIRAAKEVGIDPNIFLATALTESGGQYGAVGDSGTSFGPFQHHKGGALGSNTPAWANSYAGILERARQFKRLQITTGKGAAALQGPADPLAYAAKVNANLAKAASLTGSAGVTAPGSKPHARGPGSRGGEAINPAIQAIMDLVPNYLILSIQDVLGYARTAFADKSKRGTTALVKVLNDFGGVFDQMAKRYTTLLATQRHKLISGRYKVSGASGNTSVRDTGSDTQDLQTTLSNLGFARDALLAEFLGAKDAVTQVVKELNATPKKNKARRQLLTGVLATLRAKQQEFSDSLDQNTLDIVAAQNAIIQDAIDRINATAARAASNSDFALTLAGHGIGSTTGAIDQKIQGLQNQKNSLVAGPLADAVRNGNVDLYNQIVDIMTGIDQAIITTTIDRGQAVIDAIQKSNDRALGGNDLLSRIANLGGNSVNSLNAQTGVLANRGDVLRANRQALSFDNFAPNSLTPEQTQAVIDAQRELDVAIQENTDAQRENSEQIKQSRVDQINNLAGFRGGINSGVGGLIQSLANQTGTFDTASNVKRLQSQQNNLQTQGTGLRGQLLSNFGINLSTDPTQLIQQLNNTDFGAMEFGMDDNTKALFEGLINGIIDNATALVDNTTELKAANDQSTIQDWSSSLWSNFRDALFTGNGGILGGIPQAATGAHIISSGLLRVHAGETVSPAGTSRYESSPINIPIDIHNYQGDVDTLALTKRLAFELKTR